MNKKYEYDHSCKPGEVVDPMYKIPAMGPEFELAKAYVPYQVMQKVYEPAKGLMRGTIFPELYKPYVPQKKRDE